MLERLGQQIEGIAAASGAIVGFGFQRLGTEERLILGEGQPFPMASTYKIAMAVKLLQQVDAGEIALSDMIPIDRDELSPGGGLVKAHIYHPGLALSVHNVIGLAMTVSDNTSTDKMLELAGGPDAVTANLRAAGIDGMRIDRSTKTLITDAFGVTDKVPDGRWSYRFLLENEEPVFKVDPPEAAAEAFLADERDTSTPEAMVCLLRKLSDGELLAPESTRVLLDIMERCDSGQARLKGMLPPGVPVLHKTGTIPTVCINDGGIIRLPDGGGAIIAVFVMATAARHFIGYEAADRVIAQCARAAYDFALFATGG